MKHTDAASRVAVWSTGGFWNWLSFHAATLLLCAFFVAILLPAHAGRRGTGPRPRVSVDIYQDARAQLTTDPAMASGSAIAAVHIFASSSRRGFPFAWSRAENHWLVVSSSDLSIPESALRAAAVAHLQAHANDPTAPAFAQLAPLASTLASGGRVTTSSILSEGIILNTLVLIALLLTATAAALYIRSAYRRCRRTARGAVGLCPHCGYDLLGRTGEQCPECGADPASRP